MKRILEKQIETGRRIINRAGLNGQIDMSLEEMQTFIRRLGENKPYAVLYDAFLLGLAVGHRAGRRARDV